MPPRYIECQPVESSNLGAVGYDPSLQTLRIIFKSGHGYDYPMVPKQLFEQLMEADSKGRFFHQKIKPFYGFARLRPEQLLPPLEEGADQPDHDHKPEEEADGSN